jgi:branched-chain amino acid transport system permease protein
MSAQWTPPSPPGTGERAGVKGPAAGSSRRVPVTTWILLGLATLLLLALPHLLANAYYIHIANMTLINVVLVTGLNVISRTGQLSLCHAAFAGIGGYTSALLALHFKLPALVTVFCGAAMAGLVAWVIGSVILRLRGVFFVLVTFLFGQIFTLLLLNGAALTKGANGLVGIPPIRLGELSFASKANFYYFALFAAVLVVLLTWRLLRSPLGRAFSSVEENLPLAESTGIDTRRCQVLAFVIGSAFAGFGGAAIAHYVRYVSPDTFTFWESVAYIVMLVVGGRGTLAGGVVGAVVLTPLPELLRGAQALSHVAYGTILIVALFIAPKGLVELLRSRRSRKEGA